MGHLAMEPIFNVRVFPMWISARDVDCLNPIHMCSRIVAGLERCGSSLWTQTTFLSIIRSEIGWVLLWIAKVSRTLNFLGFALGRFGVQEMSSTLTKSLCLLICVINVDMTCWLSTGKPMR